MDSHDYFTGLWEAVQLEGCTTEGWKIFKIYDLGSFTWSFQPEGMVIERIAPRPVFKSVYSYTAEDRLLWIDRARYEYRVDREATRVGITDNYRVEPVTPDVCWLYDLTGVRREPEGYRFRIRLIRLM